MKRNPNKRTASGRMIGAMTEVGLVNLHTQLEADIWQSDDRAQGFEDTGELVKMEKERERGDRLRKELEAVERESNGRDLDRHLRENGGHPDQEPT